MKLYKALGTMLVAVAAIGCESTCEDAQEKFDSCEDEIALALDGTYPVMPFTGVSDECNEDDQCVAPCVIEADCPAIAAAIAEGPMAGDPNASPVPGKGAFIKCVEECVRESRQR